MKKTLLAFSILSLSYGMVYGQAISLPYSTGFNNSSEKAGWTEYRLGFQSNSSWHFGGGGFSGDALSHDYNVGGNQNDTVEDWMVSPALDFDGMATLSLKVRTSGFSTPTQENCQVFISTGSADPADGDYVLLGTLSHMGPQFNWLDTSFDINAPDSGYIAFRYVSIGAAWMTYAIDNIQVDKVLWWAPIAYYGSFDVHPNPASTEWHVYLPEEHFNSVLDYVVRDAFGKEVMRLNRVTEDHIRIPCSGLASGVYLVQVFQDGKLLDTQKAIVN